MSTNEKIAELEKELAALRDKARIEKEEAEKKANEERDADLLAIMNQVKVFNEKHNEHIAITVNRNSKTGQNIWDAFFPWL